MNIIKNIRAHEYSKRGGCGGSEPAKCLTFKTKNNDASFAFSGLLLSTMANVWQTNGSGNSIYKFPRSWRLVRLVEAPKRRDFYALCWKWGQCWWLVRKHIENETEGQEWPNWFILKLITFYRTTKIEYSTQNFKPYRPFFFTTILYRNTHTNATEEMNLLRKKPSVV